MYQVHVVNNASDAQQKISGLTASGYTKDDIYIFAHDKARSEDLTDATDTNNVGMKEQGMFEAMGNMFRSRGDELRSKMTNLGLTQSEAERYEEDLDHGKVVVVAAKK
ncbi:MAG: general stress protein [Bacillus sp. (in: firmicutes)]